eukprot:CAMPEP_0117429752 /NCGR_PEP_ID=MMETSP0758-20121206/9268_1 /TAXON_ID=63605 /ORGANISM="Percolomonas cosmopolitus, Strain AE-1 (ATCC 50343)" /LENGTH=30 /DNA_ID= /DNA_START= /DNA_END= /DNA_ORIENTATION=
MIEQNLAMTSVSIKKKPLQMVAILVSVKCG